MTSAKAEEVYYQGKQKMISGDYDEMKKLFEEAISLGNSSACNDLAFYWQYNNEPSCNPATNKDIRENVIKYYKMAIDRGNVNSMYNLGCFFHEQNDIENKIHYLKMASDNGDARAHFGLGMHYEEVKDYDQMQKYYNLAADVGNTQAMIALGDYFKTQGKLSEAKDQYFKALRAGDRDAVYSLDSWDLSTTSEERKEVFAFIHKLYCPEGEVDKSAKPATVKKEVKTGTTPDGKTFSYLSFTIGHD